MSANFYVVINLNSDTFLKTFFFPSRSYLRKRLSARGQPPPDLYAYPSPDYRGPPPY